MSWKDEWPGVPGEPLDDDDDPAEDESGPFRVALKESACEVSPEVAARREDGGEVVTYESRRAAEEKLLESIDCRALRLQDAAPNDPNPVDAYLIKGRELRPEPDERGPPADGWTHQLDAQQVGALAETLFGAYSYDPPPIVDFAARQLELDPDAFRVAVERAPSPVGTPESKGGSGLWRPDFEFRVRRKTDQQPYAYDGPLLHRYVAEIKHGSTSFGRNQRDQMVRHHAESDPDTTVLIVRVDLGDVPQHYDVTIRTADALE
ncbi:hypothetical protein ACFR9U_10290 [Halorientalis brevis]|uniref:Restriction endonuclease n=1 Tax=Halorientalis brevis TaxID=1126241 RepID=A0ABD6CB75_9EURY|nr:hypothetical protein [Halorientalis brevis]